MIFYSKLPWTFISGHRVLKAQDDRGHQEARSRAEGPRCEPQRQEDFAHEVQERHEDGDQMDEGEVIMTRASVYLVYDPFGFFFFYILSLKILHFYIYFYLFKNLGFPFSEFY